MRRLLKYHTFQFLCCILLIQYASSQTTKQVLFLGNSYTAANNLPQLTAQVALSCNDTLIYDSNTPGGYTFEMHTTNPTTLAKIAIGNWDYVVLQEQSQLPALQNYVVEQDVFPYASFLDSLINLHNPCAETMLYMTWGRKNGDSGFCPSWPPVCTYEGMDSLLHLRYMMMAIQNDAVVSPVGFVWNHIRQNYPSIELYSGDESHPSVAGSYAAACCFYTSIFRKNPENISYNSSLSQADADSIKKAVRTVVFDNFSEWFIGVYDPSADFSFQINDNSIAFSNNSLFSDTYFWDFGDGNNSSDMNPTHSFGSTGNYQVSLIASHCDMHDTLIQNVDILIMNVLYPNTHSLFKIYPIPASDFLIVENSDELYSHIDICDMKGQTILHIQTNEQKLVSIPIQHLHNGIYILKIQNNRKKPDNIVA